MPSPSRIKWFSGFNLQKSIQLGYIATGNILLNQVIWRKLIMTFFSLFLPNLFFDSSFAIFLVGRCFLSFCYLFDWTLFPLFLLCFWSEVFSSNFDWNNWVVSPLVFFGAKKFSQKWIWFFFVQINLIILPLLAYHPSKFGLSRWERNTLQRLQRLQRISYYPGN